MSRQIILLSLVTMVAAVAGCSMQYNGAWGFSKNAKEMVANYQQSLRERDLAMQTQGQGADANAQANTPPPHPTASIMAPMAGTMPAANLSNANMAMPMQPQAQPMLTSVSMASPDIYGRVPQQPQLPQQPILAARPSTRGDDVGNIQRITFSTEGADFDPEVDPTGQWLIFASTRHRETSDLYFKRVDGSAVTQLTNDPGNDVMPAISPDGKQIAFASDRAGNWDIYLMDANGGQSMQVTNDSAHEIHPSFSPDGRWLVYCRYGEQSGDWELVVIELANPSTKRFIGYGLFPNWSPVDNKIVFQRARERGTRWFSIWTIDLVDGQAMRPTEIAASANAAVITPDFSPDGTHIVFCTVVDSGPPSTIAGTGNNSADSPRQADIWMVDVDGRNRMNLTQSQFTNLQPVWAKDGTIFFTSNRSLARGENVWSIRPDRALAVARGAMESAKPSAMAEAATPPVP